MRRATANNQRKRQAQHISIHALLAESDSSSLKSFTDPLDFYPRSPCGERRQITQTYRAKLVFLSTLSLRRATNGHETTPCIVGISIHALLAESDSCTSIGRPKRLYFYPRSPCGERPKLLTISIFIHTFLSTLSLRRATCYSLRYSASRRHFYPRSPCGERRKSNKLATQN